MQIKPIPFSPDSTGLPAEGYAYYIGLPNENPELEANQAVVRDGRNGPQTSNPFFVNANGNFQNANGQPINPWVDAASYSVLVLDTFDARYRYIDEYSADGLVNGNDGEPEFTINNLNDLQTGAKYLSISQYETVFIQSLNSGWEDTVDGPVGGFHAHKDGTSGQASTGDENKFFDASGTGFTRNDKQRISESEFDDVVAQAATNAADVIALRSGFIDGLQTTWSGINDIIVGAGSCSDDAGSVIIDFAGSNAEINEQIPTGNREGTLDTDTWYHVFICSSSDNAPNNQNNITPKIAFSPDVSGINARAAWSNTGDNYDVSRLIWSVYVNDNSQIEKYYQYADDNMWATNSSEDVSKPGSPTLTELLSPRSIVCKVYVYSQIEAPVGTSPGPETTLFVAPGNMQSTELLSVQKIEGPQSAQSARINSVNFDIYTDLESQIWYRYFSNTLGSIVVIRRTKGFKHPRRAP